MKVALVLGGADCLWNDIERYAGPIDGCVACNEAGIEWPDDIDAWVSLHCRYFQTKRWRQRRADAGYPPALRHFGHQQALQRRAAEPDILTDDLIASHYCFPGGSRSGSSGLFAAKVALIDLGFDRVVLCGVPMTKAPHFWDPAKEPWKSAESFRDSWLDVPEEYRARMSSMSGWTKALLGPPETKEKPDA